MSAVMNDVQEAPKPAKAKPEVLKVTTQDGREVEFVGKKRFLKETLIDESKIEQADGVIQLQTGAVMLRMTWRDGRVVLIPLNLALLPKYAGHGAEQKFGDELATPADKPMTDDDQIIAIETLADLHKVGKWGLGRAEGGGGVAGAGVVVQAILAVQNAKRSASGKEPITLDVVKAHLQKTIDSTPDLTRAALYASFRAGDTEVSRKIKELEAEAAAKKAPKVDVEAALAGMGDD